MKIRTINMFQDSLDNEFSWRLREIHDLKECIRATSQPRQNTLVRAGVPLLYAHWEGFVKKSAECYLNFVSNQRLKYKELENCFVVFGTKKYIEDLKSKRTEINIAAVDFFLTKLSDRANLSLPKVNTESNLSSQVFENIVLSVGLSKQPYEAKYKLILKFCKIEKLESKWAF